MNQPASPSSRRRSCWGRYEMTLQEERGVLLPERFCAALGEEVMLLCLPTHAIRILPLALWEEGSEADKSTVLPALLSPPELGKIDPQGRLFLSSTLCEGAELFPEAPLLIVGVGEQVEIWSQAMWETYEASLERQTRGFAS